MKKIYSLMILVMMGFTLSAQTYTPLTDDYDPASNSLIKIAAGSYNLQDVGEDGLIRINGKQNIEIDGDSVMADGINYTGYLISITNSDHILIKNFGSGQHFKYAVQILNSHNIEIAHCNFSYNKVDSSGWIDVWAGYTQGLGGGVLCYQCDSILIRDNTMNMQNDGVALYNSKKANIHHNNFNWNTSYGIRMYWSDSCHIHHNLASHINRPLTDPSDCAALLMIVANENLVDSNNLSYSGDGVFLGQYQHSNVPNNNVFLYNECSGSPHNAIEATFADGNVYRHNRCNSSHYGLWLGYSFNTVVDSNEIRFNHHSGIAIDRGFNNEIQNNDISFNPIGIELWEGSPITGYQNHHSQDVQITNNHFQGNNEAAHISNTPGININGNGFVKNHNSLYFDGTTTANPSISANLIRPSVLFDIQNNSVNNFNAIGNMFYINDTAFISGKIYDKHDDPGKGLVEWHPYVAIAPLVVQHIPPAELTEESAVWYPYTEVCGWMGVPVPLSVTYDQVVKHNGQASVHLVTGTGWYNALSYSPANDSVAHWNLSNYNSLSFWIHSTNTNAGAFQYFHMRLGNSKGGYYRYNSTGSVLNQSLGNWKNYVVPLAGNASWPRQTSGTVSLSDISYVEVYTDSYGTGYELWLDGMEFQLGTGLEDEPGQSAQVTVYPNPCHERATLSLNLSSAVPASLKIFDSTGKLISNKDLPGTVPGLNTFELNTAGLPPGLYMLRLTAGDKEFVRKFQVQ